MAKRFFRRMFQARWLVLALYALLLAPAAYYAAHVRTDNSLDRMVIPGDEGKKIFTRFKQIFGSDEFILVGLEGKDIYGERFLSATDEIERRLQTVPHLAHTRSLVGIFREVNPLFNPHEAEWRDKFRAFTLSSSFFNYQGLIIPDRMLTVILQLKMSEPEHRREAVLAVDDILKPFIDQADSPFRNVRLVGQPNLNYEMDSSTMEIGTRFFPIYILFAMGFLFFLYRSLRGLAAVLITIGVSLAFTIASVTISGSVLTIISAILPMMVMIVTIETIIHIYSGYVRAPEGADRREHLIDILCGKWLACWYSVFTTVIGFGSFMFSPVLPVRDLGLFVAAGLVIAFAVSFTLFPILLDLFTLRGKPVHDFGLKLFDPILTGLPTYAYWYRKTLVPLMTLVGAFAIQSFFSMDLETNTLNYLNHDNKLYKDTVFIEDNLIGLLSVEVMLEGEEGQFSNPDTFRKLQEFESIANGSPDVQSILSASTMLRLANFVENGADAFPESNFAVSKYILALSQRDMWSSYVSGDFSKLRFSAITKNVDYHVFDRLDLMFKRVWNSFVERYPEFKDVTLTLTGMAPLTANITRFLLDTLVSSFGLTFLIVFIIFMLEIRRFSYAVIAMLPSLFAILLMYWVMTLAGVKLDIGSIMIAAVVLGISVDATIHFFQHFTEKRKAGASVEEALNHTLLISGRAVIVATVVICTGFLTFGASTFPPIKTFGLLSAVSMIFSLVGTLVYLPACIWLMSPKDKPAHLEDWTRGHFRLLPPGPPANGTKPEE